MLAWPGIATGVAAAVAMWVAWYFLHRPGLDTPLIVTGTAVGLTLVAMTALLTRVAANAPATGAIGGATAGLIGLMLLGSHIAKPQGADGAFNTQAPVIVLAFVASTTVLGLLGGLASNALGRREAREPDRDLWLRRLALAAAASYVPLIAVGGLVTSTGSGMSVPDWPGTYGSNMFLYPFALMEDPRIFYEHTHRLLGTLAGLSTVILLVGAFAMRASTTVRALAVALLAGVIVQGLLGGFRVAKDIPAFGFLHGVLGQGLLVIATITAAFVGRAFASSPAAAKTARPVFVLAAVSLACLAIQLSFGSLYRHLGSSHALYSHIGFSVIVTGAIAHVAIFSTKFKPNALGEDGSGADSSRADNGGDTEAGVRLRRLAPAIFAVLAIQFTLGFAAWGFGSGYTERPTADQLAAAGDINYLGSIIATVHQANGAALAALTGLALAWAVRAGAIARRPAAAGSENPPAAAVPQHEPNAIAGA
ncbi:MAG: COX15/CtaA family protein [Planctomycetota bacterium]